MSTVRLVIGARGLHAQEVVLVTLIAVFLVSAVDSVMLLALLKLMASNALTCRRTNFVILFVAL
jgi:hypothetical protein